MEMDKLQVPGWRIEQRFNNKVLIGNWNEQRRKFQRGDPSFGNSTHRIDYTKYGSYIPDMRIRREAAMRNDGLSRKFIFSHHGNNYSNNLISWYDQHMNQRDVKEAKLPELRSYDGKLMAWVPERTDHPLQGEPTNFGLLDKMKEKWQKELENDRISPFNSTYKLSFNEHPKAAMIFKHYATQKPLSSHLHPHRVNKDLPLRNTNVNIGPEYPPLITDVNLVENHQT